MKTEEKTTGEKFGNAWKCYGRLQRDILRKLGNAMESYEKLQEIMKE